MALLEEFHSVCISYLWLSYKFENSFVEYELCCLILERVYDLINVALENNDRKRAGIFQDDQKPTDKTNASQTLYTSFMSGK